MDRRTFLQSSGVAALAASGVVAQTRRAAAKNLANERITVMVAGVGGRGGSLLQTFAGMDDVDVKYVCDIDERILGARTEDLLKNNERSGQEAAGEDQGFSPRTRRQGGRTPSCWARPTIGTPFRRSWPAWPARTCTSKSPTATTLSKAARWWPPPRSTAASCSWARKPQRPALAQGDGVHPHRPARPRACCAKAWESSKQGSHRQAARRRAAGRRGLRHVAGPAPKRPFNPVRFHGNWRWFFDYGTGDLGNDGVHRLDVRAVGARNGDRRERRKAAGQSACACRASAASTTSTTRRSGPIR